MTNAEMILNFIETRKKLAQGWCQGDLYRYDDHDERHERCLVGALYGDGECVVSSYQTINVLKRVLAIPTDTMWWPPQDLISWNDAPGRTQQEVLDLVDRAIASLMKVEAPEVVEELVPA